MNETDVKGGNQDDNKYSNAMDRMDIYSDSNENAIKTGDEITEDDRPPRLPPRPPPRPRNTMSTETGMINSSLFFNSKCLPLCCCWKIEKVSSFYSTAAARSHGMMRRYKCM